VVPQLRRLGVAAIDLLIGTHPHADHIGQFPQVLARYPVTEVWMSGGAHTSLTFERAVDTILASDAAANRGRTRAIRLAPPSSRC
jgi:competence protein ComEC